MRRFLSIFIFGACGLVLAAPALRAALEFETAEIILKPALGDKAPSAEFKFKNTGDTPVTITRVHSGCGCTVPEKPAEAIAPGASGGIPVVYKPGERQGRQSQTIQVETSDGKNHDLRLVVDLPIRVSFAPRLLLFRGAESEAKTATVTYSDETKAELLDIQMQSPAFEIMGEPRIEGSVLKISIRHVGDAAADSRGSVRVRTRDAAGQEHTDLLYVRHSP